MNLLTLWRCDVRVVQRVHDAGVIFTERQVFYQMGHVYLQDDRQEDYKVTDFCSAIDNIFIPDVCFCE